MAYCGAGVRGRQGADTIRLGHIPGPSAATTDALLACKRTSSPGSAEQHRAGCTAAAGWCHQHHLNRRRRRPPSTHLLHQEHRSPGGLGAGAIAGAQADEAHYRGVAQPRQHARLLDEADHVVLALQRVRLQALDRHRLLDERACRGSLGCRQQRRLHLCGQGEGLGCGQGGLRGEAAAMGVALLLQSIRYCRAVPATPARPDPGELGPGAAGAAAAAASRHCAHPRTRPPRAA